MDTLTHWIGEVNSVVWGPLMLVLLAGVGLYLTLGLKLIQMRRLGFGFRMLWSGRVWKNTYSIPPFYALMTSLSATIGTGNIAGVATAIYLGGPGALFWMWAIALLGMATKYAEAVLAVHFRETDHLGAYVGGPMYYIKNGMGERWKWLAVCFAVFGAMAGFGIGNTVQANSVADALQSTWHVPPVLSGSVLAGLTAMVLVGGLQRLAKVAGKIVPVMALLYVGSAIVILIINADQIPAAFALIFDSAFAPAPAVGGFAGATMMMAIRFGIARGVFSNEAGLGSAPIAHASADTDSPVRQGTIAMLGTFIDTMIICTMTGLVILTSGVWSSGLNGASLSSAAFEASLPGVGAYLVSVALAFFAFTTILGWSLYSERCLQFLFGDRVVWPFRYAWILCLIPGALFSIDFVWLVADTLNAMMAIPNLIALIALSPVIFKLTREFFTDDDSPSEPE